MTHFIKSFVAMFETNSFEHGQPLDLGSGNYEYFFRCIDAGGNAAETNVLIHCDTRRLPSCVCVGVCVCVCVCQCVSVCVC